MASALVPRWQALLAVALSLIMQPRALCAFQPPLPSRPIIATTTTTTTASDVAVTSSSRREGTAAARHTVHDTLLHDSSQKEPSSSPTSAASAVVVVAPNSSANRRSLFAPATTTVTTMMIFTTATTVPLFSAANAGIDPTALKGYAVEGDQTGVQTRLRQIELEKIRPSDAVDLPYTELPSGVSFREFREGKGDATVQTGSKVGVELTARCKALATAGEPGGLKYFSTAVDTEFNELAFTVGTGQMPPALEEGMMGMRRGAVRRIQVPSTAVYAAKKLNQLPLPTTKDGQRRFDSLFKTDATLIFEVLVTRIKY